VTTRATADGPDDGDNGRGTAKRADGLLTTGDMARITGNTLRTVRFYEEAGILRPDRRSAGGHRLFSQRELDRLQFITDLRTAGLSLDAIRSLLELKDNADTGSTAAGAALEAINEQIESLDHKLELFTRLRTELLQARELLTNCKDCTNDRCFPDACNECEVVADKKLPTSMRVLWSLDTE
jgi:DNA-binding transcriptional MerR regulator